MISEALSQFEVIWKSYEFSTQVDVQIVKVRTKVSMPVAFSFI